MILNSENEKACAAQTCGTSHINILVCLKMVSQATYTDALGGESSSADRLSGGRLGINPADAYALELALRVKDGLPQTKVTVLTMAPDSAETMLRDALATGADRAVHVSDVMFAGADTIATAKTLAAAVKATGMPDLILCGKKAIDSETGHIGPQLAVLLGLRFVSNVLELECGSDGSVSFTRSDDYGVSASGTRLPAVLSIVNGTGMVRKPTIMGMRRSRGAVIERLDGRALGMTAENAGRNASGTETVSVTEIRFAHRHGERETDASAGAERIAGMIGALGRPGGQEPRLGEAEDPAEAGLFAQRIFKEPDGTGAEFWVVLGRVCPSSAGLIEKAEELASRRGMQVRVLSFPDGHLENQETVRRELVRLYREHGPEAVVFERSQFFGDVAPAFAMEIERGITADCTELRWDGDSGLLQIRPTFGGRKIAVNRSTRLPYIATVRKGVFAAKGADAFPAGDGSLEGAPVIFSGGAGLGSRENYGRLKELALRAGAVAGASRAAVAAGYAPYSSQIGQTGVSVRPKLYLAFGISGAVQHLSGITGAEKIVAVNSDPKAPIHDFADCSVIADANEVIRELERRIGSPG